jgi:AraC-like DNA-binding protein
MKPQLLKVSTAPAHSFSVRQDHIPHMNNRWHYHAEVELIHLKSGTGTQFIGDNIRRFSNGDVLLVGAHLPHYWRFDDNYFEGEQRALADIRVAHFCDNFWGDKFLALPENHAIKSVLEKAKRGIKVGGKARKEVALLIEKMLHQEGPKKIVYLIEALLTIAECEQVETLSSIGFQHKFNDDENDRINAIYEYSMLNFRQKIELKEIASVARVSPNSFCRYFKSRTKKTYSQFLLELKVGHSCKLLIENRLSIKQLCYESGFNNFSSFHKYFKQITGKSPLQYQKDFFKPTGA